MSRPPAINADGRFVFCNELAKTARRLQSRRITRARRRAGVVRHRDCLKTSVAGRLMTAVPNDVGQISKILSSCVGWAKRQRAHHPRRARDGGHGASAPLSTLRNSVWGSLAKTICHSDFNLIWVVQSLREKYFAVPVGQISSTSSPRPFPARGALRGRHERGMGCGGRGSVGAQGGRRARLNS